MLRQECFVGVGRIGLRRKPASSRNTGNPHQLLRIMKRQWLQQNGIHDTENRDIRTNAKTENQDGNCREGWIASKRAECVAQVEPENVEPLESARLALLLLCLLHSSKPDECLAAGLFGGHALLQVILNRNLQMGGHLHVEFPIYLRVRKRGAQTLKYKFHPIHLCSPCIASTRPITSERRRQYAESSASCLRPFFVIK